MTSGLCEKAVAAWNFATVSIDVAVAAQLEQYEAQRITDGMLIHDAFSILTSFGVGAQVSTQALASWLDQASLGSVDTAAWFPKETKKALVDQVAESFAQFVNTTEALEKLGLQRWLASKTVGPLAGAFGAPLQAQTASAQRTKLAGEQSAWLSNLSQAYAGVGTWALSPADRHIVRRIMLDDDLLARISQDIVVSGCNLSTGDIIHCLACEGVFCITKLLVVGMPAPNWEESISFDPPLKNIVECKKALHNIADTIRGRTCEQYLGPRLEVLSSWLAWCGVAYMKNRCELIDARLEQMKDLVDRGPLFDTMSKLDADDITTISDADRKMMLQTATKSTGVKSMVEAYNLSDSICAWPTAIKQQLDGTPNALGPKTDILDATVREHAEGGKSRCEFVLAHCTFVQALLKTASGPKERQAAAKREACKMALQRASSWEVDLKPAVRAAVDAAFGEASD